ncbi:hypothetical protein CRYUN_Cryun30bG0008100 [Craigia yunnanensis]
MFRKYSEQEAQGHVNVWRKQKRRANQSPFSCRDVRLRMTREKERERGEGSV